ncbi:MAG: 30S ribosomal protein S6 [Patescibacteria group bacterium]
MSEAETINKYEMAYLLSPEVSEENLDLETTELQKIIRESGGEVTESLNPKKRWLSYEVKKQRQAYFGFILFKIQSEGIGKIKSVLSLHKKIMRFLIVNYSEIELKNVSDANKNIDINSELKSTNGQSFEKKLESILNG